ncbi:MAG: hypothetical protein WCL49_03545 [bacterium]
MDDTNNKDVTGMSFFNYNDNNNDNDNSGQEADDGKDRREENAKLYERPNRSTDRASAAQINYVRILLRDGFLERDDFRSSREFFRKKTTLTIERANCLIKVGKKRLKDCNARQREAQERRW